MRHMDGIIAVLEPSHSFLETKTRAAVRRDGGDGTGKAAPSHGALRALTV